MTPDALWAAAAAVTGIWAVTVMTPGPNFIATIHAAGGSSPRHGVAVALGIAVGTAIWATASLAGLGLLFQAVGGLYVAVKLAGAAYLVIIGFRMMLTRRQVDGDDGAAADPALSMVGAFRLGLLTDLANPKAAAFFASLFAVAVPPSAPLWFEALLIASVVAIAGGWYGLAALAMGRPSIAAAYRKARVWITRVAGLCFVAFGANLAAGR